MMYVANELHHINTLLEEPNNNVLCIQKINSLINYINVDKIIMRESIEI